MGKRANGEGSVFRRGDGRWAATLTYVDALGLARRQVFYGKTQAEARDKLKAAKARTDKGAAPKDAKVKVGDYAERWIRTSLAASDRKATTRQTYGILARKWITGGAIGEVRLDRLKATDVEGLILTMRADGKADATVRQTYTILRAILDGAVRDHLVAVNVAALVKRPGVARVEARSLSAVELQGLYVEADKSRYGTLIRLLAMTGLRRGEALALRWSDVDLVDGSVRVAGTLSRVGGVLGVTEPKTALSRRTVPLAAPLVTMLREHKTRQAAERLKAGSAWHDLGLVFATEAGGYVDPRNALRVLQVAAKAAGVEGVVGLHTLRHTFATTMLSAGVPLITVSHLLGHSSVAITGDVYGHVSTGDQRSAVELAAKALG